MRFVIIFFLLTLGLPLLIVGAWYGHAEWVEYRFRHDSPLAADLNGGWDDMRDRFRDRVRRQFPVGTPISELVATLTAQNFEPMTEVPPSVFTTRDAETAKLAALPDSSKMTILSPNTFCDSFWTVGWELDTNQRVTRTYGELSGYCL